MLAIRVIMPASGDAELLQQDSGTVDLEPVFYGHEASGPHIQICELEAVEGTDSKKPGSTKREYKVTKVLSRYRIVLKSGGATLKLMKASPSK